MRPDLGLCIAGSTFEKTYTDLEPDATVASQEIFRRLGQALPFLPDLELVDVAAGLRATTPDHQPIAGRLAERIWMLAGLGSKGLLLHGNLARSVTRDLYTVLTQTSTQLNTYSSK